MSIFDKWNQVQPKEVSGPQKGYMVLNKSRTQILSSPNSRLNFITKGYINHDYLA